jgi:collagenase-like protein with putative collagen-binding domain
MRFARQLIESRPPLSRVPDQTLITDDLEGADHIAATRGDGYAFIYTAQGRAFTARFGKISGERVKCWWFNPRSGDSITAGEFDNTGTRAFKTPSEGFGSDWILIIDDASKSFSSPHII